MAEGGTGRSRTLRPISYAILAAVVLVTAVGAWLMHGVVNDQERRLLDERTKEVQAYLQGTFGTIPAQFGALLAVAASTQGSPAAFAGNATPLVAPDPSKGGFASLELLKVDGGTATVLATAGAAEEQPGEPVSRPVRRALVESVAAGGFGSTPVYRVGDERHLDLALGGAGYVVLTDSQIHPYTGASPNPNAPFHEVLGAVYAAGEPVTDQAVISSVPLAKLPLEGNTGSATVTLGSGPQQVKWLLVIKPRGWLAGGVAHAVPWIMLAAGLVIAGVATGTVEALARRRRYALELVDERTAELRTSLEELARTQRELVRQERLAAVGQFASTVGHELRNPLSVLTNALYLIRSHVGRLAEPLPESLTRNLDAADREVGAAERIVQDILEFSRDREPRRTETDLVGLVEEALTVTPPPDGVQVSTEFADALPPASVDRDQLRQVLLNLLTNAYQAMPDGGVLTVRVQVVNGAVSVSVADTGQGMDERTQAQVFEPFFTTKARGVGLGLAVCRRVVEAHGGTLAVTSAPGEGSTFRLVLPVVAAPRSPQDAGQTTAERTGVSP